MFIYIHKFSPTKEPNIERYGYCFFVCVFLYIFTFHRQINEKSFLFYIKQRKNIIIYKQNKKNTKKKNDRNKKQNLF